MSWLTVTIQNQRKQKAAAEAIWKLGGLAAVEPTGLGRLLSDNSLVRVTWVCLSGMSITENVLVHLQGLRHLERLYLDKTNITDDDLVHLQRLGQLKALGLDGTQVSDVGLAHLKGLSQLQSLFLRKTKVTDQGVKKLQQALPNCTIHH
jgi:internalin A